jgi:hypothetical protein
MNTIETAPVEITADAADAAEALDTLATTTTPTQERQEPEYDPDQDEAEDPLFSEDNRATYCPEDDKLRLYVGRVPRAEYEELRAEGWTSTPKQSEAGQGEFAAIWTPARKARAERYAGIVEDEDAGPAERAADRAERFSCYREKRRSEAHGHADRYDAPRTHGYQSQARAERAAARHDRHAGYAVDAWSKAEYWQQRTAGVIQNALYKSTPAVRMGRIKTLEAELRKAEKTNEGYAETYRRIARWAEKMPEVLAAYAARFQCDAARAERGICDEIAGYGKHRNPRDPAAEPAYYFEHMQSEHPPTAQDYAAQYLRTHHHPESEGFKGTSIAQAIQHLQHRLAYELQMLDAQGGRAAFVEMEPGGFIGRHQIQKVNKSPATGRTVSVQVLAATNAYCNREGKPYDENNPRPLTLHTLKVERMAESEYRAPTAEEREAFHAAKKAAKAAAPKADPCPLINPTDEDAERLQSIWNAANPPSRWDTNKEPKQVHRMTQEQYSKNSSGTYRAFETVIICEDGTEHRTRQGRNITRYSLCKIREHSGRVIVITDKPQKPVPWQAIADACAKCPTRESIAPQLPQLAEDMRRAGWSRDIKSQQLFTDAQYVGYAFHSSMSQYGLTDAGQAALKAQQEANKAPQELTQAALAI